MTTIMDPARPPFKRKPIAILGGETNGLLNPQVLVASTARNLKLNVVSVRKFNALQAKAIREGIPLTSTGDYRTRASQDSLLLQRYDRGYIAGRGDYNYYQGTWWSLKPGMAPAATPGESPHGWGRARDFAVMLAGDTIPDSLRTSDKRWLASNAPAFGIYFDTKSEDWHGEDYDGDVIAQAVLDEERGNNGAPIPIFDPANGQFSLYPLDPGKATLYLKDPPFQSDLVAYLQGVIKKAGYQVTVDGGFGPKTNEAVLWFQRSWGLEADGRVGPKTWAQVDAVALQGAGGPPPFDPTNGLFGDYPGIAKATVKQGAVGDAVSYLQGVLKFRCGHAILVDGQFGPTTNDHVMWFQGVNGLTIDGVVGPKTWAVVDNYGR